MTNEERPSETQLERISVVDYEVVRDRLGHVMDRGGLSAEEELRAEMVMDAWRIYYVTDDATSLRTLGLFPPLEEDDEE